MSTAGTALWTAVPADTTNQVTAKLSDGSTNISSITSMVAYRCVCGATVPKSFMGKHCNGDPGTECYTAGALNFDAKDRAQLRHSSALWECANDRAHLAEASTLSDIRCCDGDMHRCRRAPRVGARPHRGGSGTFVMTSDLTNFGGPQLQVVKWTAIDTAFSDQYPTDIGASPLEARAYRCMWTNEQR